MENYEFLYSYMKPIKSRYKGKISGVHVEIPGDCNCDKPSIKFHYWANEIVKNREKYCDIIREFHKIFFGNGLVIPKISIHSINFLESDNPPEFKVGLKTGNKDPYCNQYAIFVGLEKLMSIEMVTE